MVHSVQIFVTSFFSNLLFTNSNSGARVGKGIAKIGSPNPHPIVCEGIAPIWAPAALDTSAATAEYLNTEVIPAIPKIRATGRNAHLPFLRTFVYMSGQTARLTRHCLS
jgi:hypothetical protein